jgi:hypothetical protein
MHPICTYSTHSSPLPVLGVPSALHRRRQDYIKHEQQPPSDWRTRRPHKALPYAAIWLDGRPPTSSPVGSLWCVGCEGLSIGAFLPCVHCQAHLTGLALQIILLFHSLYETRGTAFLCTNSLPPVKRYPSVADKYSHLGDNTSYLICWRQQIKFRRTLG